MNKYLKSVTPYIPITLRNAAYLVESFALVILAYYGYDQARRQVSHNHFLKIVIASALIVALRGAYEFIRYLANKEVR